MTSPKKDKEKNVTIMVGICNSQDHLPSRFFWSFLGALMDCPYRVGVIPGMHPWDAIRNNQIIQRFLQSEADIFVKMDVDQVYPVNYFAAMVPLVEKYKVIGPLLFDRWIENNFMPLLFQSHFGEKLVTYQPPTLTGIQEVPYNHTNLFYSREVLEAIAHMKPWYDPHIRPDGLRRMNHLDYTFLDKIKKAGYRLYTNFDVVIKHVAQIPIGVEEYLKLRTEEKVESQGLVQSEPDAIS